eukprot:312343_1
MSFNGTQSLPWCEIGSPDPVITVVYYTELIIFVVNIILGSIGTFYIATKVDKKTKLDILIVVITALFIISPSGFAFGTQAGWQCWYGFRGWEAIVMVGVVSYQYGLATLCLYFVLRLKFIFNSTALQIKKIELFVLFIGLLLQFICPIISCYYFLLAWDPMVRKTGLRWFSAATYAYIVFDGIILILFIKRILVLSKSMIPVTSATNQKKTDENNKGNIPEELLLVVIRFMVCAGLAMFSSVIVACWNLVRSEIKSLHSDLRARAIANILLAFDCMVNLICLYLQSSFGKRAYQKCCCYLEQCARKCFVNCLDLNVKSKTDIIEIS